VVTARWRPEDMSPPVLGPSNDAIQRHAGDTIKHQQSQSQKNRRAR
jgi:hypothetical protein